MIKTFRITWIKYTQIDPKFHSQNWSIWLIKVGHWSKISWISSQIINFLLRLPLNIHLRNISLRIRFKNFDQWPALRNFQKFSFTKVTKSSLFLLDCLTSASQLISGITADLNIQTLLALAQCFGFLKVSNLLTWHQLRNRFLSITYR